MALSLDSISSILLQGNHKFAIKVNEQFINSQYSSNTDTQESLNSYIKALFYLTEALQYRLDKNTIDDTTEYLAEELQRRLGTYIDTVSVDPNYTPPTGQILIPTGSLINTFLLLLDTPDSYIGQSNKLVTVKSDATGLTFTTPPAIPTVDNGLTASPGNPSNFQLGGTLTNSGTTYIEIPAGKSLYFGNKSANDVVSPFGAYNIFGNDYSQIGGVTSDGVTEATIGADYSNPSYPSVGLYINAYNGTGFDLSLSLNKTTDVTQQGVIIDDTVYSLGARYAADYSTNGIIHDRWLTDYGAVKTLVNTVRPDSPLTGLTTTISGANVLVTSGSWRIGGVVYSTSSTTTLTHSTQDATLSRYDTVYADTSNIIHIQYGSLSATPVPSDIPLNTVKIKDVLVTPTSVTVITPAISNFVSTNTTQTISGAKTFSGSTTVTGFFEALGGLVVEGPGDWYGRLQIRSDGSPGQGSVLFANQYSAGYSCSIYQTNINGPSDLVLSNTGYAGSLRARGNDLYDSSGNIFLKSGGGSTVAWSSITSKPTTLSGFGITDAISAAGGSMTGALNITTATGVSPLTITAFNGGYLGVTSTGLSFKGVSTDFTNNGSTNLLHLGDGTQSALSSMPHLQVTTAPSVSNDVVRLTDLSAYLKLSGGNLTGDVQQSVSPVNSSSLITKGYVDTAIANSSIYFASGTLLGAGTSGSPYSPNATNGLTVSVGNGIQLGGSLTVNTTVTLGSFSLTFNGTPTVTGIKTASGTGANVFLDNGTLVATSSFGGSGASLSTANTWTALQTFGTNISIGGVTSTGATGTGKNVFSIAPAFTGGMSITGNISINGSTSGVITLQPQAAAGTYNWNYPITAGTAGYFLTSQAGGSTAMTWTDPTTIAALSSTKWAIARTLAGNSVDGSANVAFTNKFIVQGTTDTGLTGAQFLGALGTGLVKNTTTTGVLSIAVAGTDYLATTGGSTITTLGTITTGIWNGTAIANANLANSTISGVALGGTLAALTATNTTLTFSASYTGTAAQTVGLNLSNANTWAAIQTFGTNISIGGVTTTGATGTGKVVFDTSPLLATPTIGVATATSINKVAITEPATASTLTIADGGTLQQTGAFVLNLTTTAASTPTFPTGAGTLAYLAGANTWSNLNTYTQNNIGVTSTDALLLANTAAAGSSTPQWSPAIHFQGAYWNGSATASTDWKIENQAQAAGSNQGLLVFRYSNAGAAYNTAAYFNPGGITTGGIMTLNQGFFGATSTDVLFLTNGAASTVGTVNQKSGAIRFLGSVWNTTTTAAANYFAFREEASGNSGLVPTAEIDWYGYVGTSTTPSFGSKIASLDNLGNYTAVNSVNTKHIVGTSSTPTQVAGVGAGTTPTMAISGNDMAMRLSITTGTTPTGSNAIVTTVTFNTAYGVAPKVILTPANAAAAALTGVTMPYIEDSSSTTTTFVLKSGSTALTASTAYIFYAHVIQ